jgi:SAM-dependent methyltransferase
LSSPGSERRRAEGRSLCQGQRLSFGTSTGATRGSYRRDFEATLVDVIGRLDDGTTIAELGAGANPALAVHPRVLAGDVDLLMIDISQGELDKAPAVGKKVCADVTAPDFPLVEVVDLACSQMLAEHVADGAQFLRNVARMLKPGGLYLQVSPVLGTIPFLVNRFVPEDLGDRLLDLFQPRDRYRHDKFPAYYDLCRGPYGGHLEQLEQAGLRVEAARGYFGHNYYGRFPGLRDLEVWKSQTLAEHPVPRLCSFSVYLLARR